MSFKKLERESIISYLRIFFNEKGEDFKICIALLFGSLAMRLVKKSSDIDIAILFEDEPLEDEIFERLTSLSLLLSEHLGLDVDIIPIHKDFRKPFLYYNAIIFGIPLFIKNRQKFIALKLEALYHMEDFSIFGIRWQIELAKRNIEAIKNARI